MTNVIETAKVQSSDGREPFSLMTLTLQNPETQTNKFSGIPPYSNHLFYHDNNLSEIFPCQVGVRRDENLSPLLFAMYLNYYHSSVKYMIIYKGKLKHSQVT